MTIWEAPVTTPFGQVPGYPLNNGFHNGIDYSCAVGTEVTVNGNVIGLSGNTGASTGPHCHVGHWGPNGVIAPGFQGGKIVSGAKVTQVSEDPTNGKFVRVQDADGTTWVYLHLSKQLVTVGQTLNQQGGYMAFWNDGDVINLTRAGNLDPNYQPPGTDFDYYKANDKQAKELVYNVVGQLQNALTVKQGAVDFATFVANTRGEQLNKLGALLGTGDVTDDTSFKALTDAIKKLQAGTGYKAYNGKQLYVKKG